MKTQDIPYNLFAKFFSGEISESEQILLDKFLVENPDNENIFEDYEIIWSTEANDDLFDNKTESALQSVKKQINVQKKTIPIKNNRIWMRIAASIIVIFGLTYFFYNNFQCSSVQYVSIESGNKIKEHKLADGSIVWLNKNSKLEFPEKFANDKRIVKMTGEAYFIVAHNKQKPFIVETENTTIEVLGTEFNLKSFDNEQDIELVLSKGKVRFTDIKSKLSEVMKVNDKITLNKKERKIIKETVSNTNFLSWKTNELTFNNMKLKDIARTLSEYYKIEVRADSSSKDLIFNSSLPFNNAKAEDILNTIKFTMGINIDSVGGEVILKK